MACSSGESSTRTTEWRQLLIVSATNFFLIGVRTAIQNIQSSLNYDSGMGVTIVATTFACFLLSCIFAPIILRTCTLRTVTIIHAVCQLIFIGANIHPLWPTVILASVAIGSTLGPFWTGTFVFIVTLSERHATVTANPLVWVTSRFYGVFFSFTIFAIFMANLTMSLVFHLGNIPPAVNGSALPAINRSTLPAINRSNVAVCGAVDCPYTGNETFVIKKPQQNQVYIFFGICGFLSIVALITAALYYEKESSKSGKLSVKKEILSTVLLPLKNVRSALLVPFFIGQTFTLSVLQADFTKSYITCAIGIGMIGYTTTCFSVGYFFASSIFSNLAKYTGRIPQIVFAEILYMALLIFLYLWTPTDDIVLYFVVTTLWGFGEPIFLAQGNTLVAEAFPNKHNPAFANLNLWRSVGFTLSFALSGVLCVTPKLFLALGIQIVGTITYVCVELMVRRNNKSLLKNTQPVPANVEASAELLDAQKKT